MAGLAYPLRLGVLAALVAATGWAQAAAPVAPAAADPPVSPKLARLFGGAPPKFHPPETPEAAPAPASGEDQPHNEIVRLPLFLVREPRPIEKNDVMTAQAREDAIVKRYVGDPSGLDVALNKFTLNTVWKKIPLLGPNSDFASLTYGQRIALDYSRIEARRKYVEALGVSADVPPAKPATGGKPASEDGK